MTLTRRQILSTLGIGGLALATARTSGAAWPGSLEQAGAPGGPFSLAPLPYPFAALEPHIDAQTMQIHHDRHHQAYVTNLNTAVANAGAAGKMPLDEMLKNLSQVPESVRTAVRNNGGGHWNHMQFWTLMAPNAGGPPTGAVADAITSTFGSFDKFKEMFAAAAMGRFGSGWAWLSDDNGTLVIHSTANQDTPSMENKRGIFGLDVWEHAYYLKYQNRRADYVTAFWNVINWAEVNKRLKA
ncbi:MAG: superoxide dismutase [Acidobacteria bacterium]|nr:superoxide dismutase [Acidobacteriota bacterium]